MKLFAVIYLKGHLAMAMALWPNATVQDCQKLNQEYTTKILPKTEAVRSGLVSMKDIRATCEYHPVNPVIKGTKA